MGIDHSCHSGHPLFPGSDAMRQVYLFSSKTTGWKARNADLRMMQSAGDSGMLIYSPEDKVQVRFYPAFRPLLRMPVQLWVLCKRRVVSNINIQTIDEFY